MSARETLRRLGAVAGLAALAGCSEGDGTPGDAADDADATSGTPSAPPTSEGKPGAGDGGTPRAGTATEGREETPGTGGGTDSPPPTATEPATPTPTPDEACRERADELEADVASVEDDVAARRAALSRLEARESWLRKPVDFLDRSYGDATREAAESLGRDVRESTLFLRPGGGVATGWVIAEGLLVTNAHNVAYPGEETTPSFPAYSIDGERYDCELVEMVDSLTPDVALVRAEGVENPLPTGSVDSVAEGDPIVQVGHPGSYGAWVISMGRMLRTETFRPAAGAFEELQTTVPGLPGNSGSPVVDLDGRVVGMTHGGIPLLNEDFSAYPTPDPVAVYDGLMMKMETGAHVGIDVIERLVEEWS